MKKTLCAILCYNNENTLSKVIEEKKKLKGVCDFIFINDGSKDNSAKVLKSSKFNESIVKRKILFIFIQYIHKTLFDFTLKLIIKIQY